MVNKFLTSVKFALQKYRTETEKAMDKEQAKLNILEYAQREQAGFSKAIQDFSGYKTFTTFWGDLTIAEVYGEEAVRETFERVTRDWGQNYKYYTEFVLCLNHKIWRYYKSNESLARVYDELWRRGDDYARDNFSPEGQEYYWQVTD